jgi:hypothetical protein
MLRIENFGRILECTSLSDSTIISGKVQWEVQSHSPVIAGGRYVGERLLITATDRSNWPVTVYFKIDDNHICINIRSSEFVGIKKAHLHIDHFKSPHELFQLIINTIITSF